MSDHESDEDWLVSEPAMIQWLDQDTQKPRYLGFSSPASWRSHLTLNLGLDLLDSKREALFWFRLPIRVKSRSAASKKPAKFYVYFIVEPDMFDLTHADGHPPLSFSHPSSTTTTTTTTTTPPLPPPVQFAFKSSNTCHSDADLVRLRFALRSPGLAIMPKPPADDEPSPYEPSPVNVAVLLALKSLTQATAFAVYLPRRALPDARLETLCEMVRRGGLAARPRGLGTLYHGRGGEVNAWGAFALEGPRAAEEGARGEVRVVEESVEPRRPPPQEHLPPSYDHAVSSASAFARTAGAEAEAASERRPGARTARSRSFTAGDGAATPSSERARRSSAPPTFRSCVERHSTSSASLEARRQSAPRPPAAETSAPATAATLDPPPDAAPPPPYHKRPKPPSDDERDNTTATNVTPRRDRRPSSSSSKRPKHRPDKKVRFSTPPPPSPPSSLPQPTTPTATACALALPEPRATLLRATVDWFKWAWTTQPRAHVGLTRPHLLELGYRARAGDERGFWRCRARCSARVLVWGEGGGGDGEKRGLVARLEDLLVWMAEEVDPMAESAVTGELREVGRLAREGDEGAFVHGCAVCAGLVVVRFGRVVGEEEGRE